MSEQKEFDTVNIFLMGAGGLKGHIQHICRDGESVVEAFMRITQEATKLGAQPEPQPVRGGFGGGGGGKPQGKELPIVEGETCSVCGGPVVEKQRPNKDGTKNWRIWECKNWKCAKDNHGYTTFKKHKDEILPLIEKAQSEPSLKAIGKTIADERFFEADKQVLTDAYRKAQDRLRAGA